LELTQEPELPVPYHNVGGVTFSADTSKLDEALATAQGSIMGALKKSENDAFKKDGKASTFADLEACFDACRKALSDNRISFTQWIATPSDFSRVRITTRLGCFGQFIMSSFEIPTRKNDAHGVAGAITYARRYGLVSAVGIAQEDDDGNTAAGVDSKAKPEPKPKTPINVTPPLPKKPVAPEDIPQPQPNYDIPEGLTPRQYLKQLADEKAIQPNEMKDIIERVTGKRVMSSALDPEQTKKVIDYVSKLIANPPVPKGGL